MGEVGQYCRRSGTVLWEKWDSTMGEVGHSREKWDSTMGEVGQSREKWDSTMGEVGQYYGRSGTVLGQPRRSGTVL